MKKKKQAPPSPPILCWDVYAQGLYKMIREKKKFNSVTPRTEPKNKTKDETQQ